MDFSAVMSKALARLTPTSELGAPLEELVERARGYAADCRASSTRRAYLSDFSTSRRSPTQGAR